jgi:ribosomal protein L11 methyltransferase
VIELHIQGVQAAEVEQLSGFLEEMGAVSVTLFDSADCPVLEPAPGETPLWPKVEIKALFQDDIKLALCEQLISVLYPTLHTKHQSIQERIWEDEWKTLVQPMCFGEHLWVCPSHLPPPDPLAINLILDPGLAFGTGSHPTTALCLQWLDQQNLHQQKMIDFGCGTGILMIAALKLGASFAYGVDIDPQAITATAQNAQLNSIDPTHFAVGDIQIIETIQPVDFIIANILNPLIELKSTFAQHLKPKGYLVVSGVLSEQIPDLVEQYQPEFQVQTIQHLDQWGLVVFRV